jgi:hypothetical protein
LKRRSERKARGAQEIRGPENKWEVKRRRGREARGADE